MFQFRKEDGSFIKLKLKDDIVSDNKYADSLKTLEKDKKKYFLRFGKSDLLIAENADESKNSCVSKLDWFEVDSRFIP